MYTRRTWVLRAVQWQLDVQLKEARRLLIPIAGTAESLIVEQVDRQREPGNAIRIGAVRHVGEFTPDGERVLRPVPGVGIWFAEKYLADVIAALQELEQVEVELNEAKEKEDHGE